MKEISELDLPDDVRYSDDHEWVKTQDGVVRIGVTDYAQDQLGDITYVEMPAVGDSLKQGQAFGTVESTKAASETLMPVAGEITRVNEALEESPELINHSPYGEGWIIEAKPDDPGQVDSLMNREEYIRMLKRTD